MKVLKFIFSKDVYVSFSNQGVFHLFSRAHCLLFYPLSVPGTTFSLMLYKMPYNFCLWAWYCHFKYVVITFSSSSQATQKLAL